MISRARVWRPSYRSAAPTHSTPGSVIASASRPEPCMPIPIMPKRMRSLGATDCAAEVEGWGSRTIMFSAFAVDAAKKLPAAAALVCRNSRREKSFLFFM